MQVHMRKPPARQCHRRDAVQRSQGHGVPAHGRSLSQGAAANCSHRDGLGHDAQCCMTCPSQAHTSIYKWSVPTHGWRPSSKPAFPWNAEGQGHASMSCRVNAELGCSQQCPLEGPINVGSHCIYTAPNSAGVGGALHPVWCSPLQFLSSPAIISSLYYIE